MMKQAQQMQKKMEEADQELRSIEIIGESGSGAVIIKSNAKNEVTSVKIRPEAINPENPESVDEETIEMLEDLVLSAIQDAHKKAAAATEQKMNSMTGGLPIKIPGLF